MTFGENLQRLRAKAGLSQSALAKAAGVPVKSLQNWEIDRAQPRIGVLAKLAQALGVQAGELLAFDMPPAEEAEQDKPEKKPRKGKGK